MFTSAHHRHGPAVKTAAPKALHSHTATERYYFQVDAEFLAARQRAARKRIKTEEKRARQRTSEQVLTKLTTTTESGEPTRRRRIGPEATRTERKPTMQRWNKRSNRPLPAERGV